MIVHACLIVLSPRKAWFSTFLGNPPKSAAMSSKQLLRVKEVPVDISTKLKQHNIITCKDFLNCSPLELMNILSFSYPQLLSLSASVCTQLAPKSQTVLSLFNARKLKEQSGFLPTSLLKLDTVLHGGLPTATITEIVGPPGCGKTQFCMLLSVVAALPLSVGGRGAHVLYVDTEASFSAERLVEIAKCRYPPLSTNMDQLSSMAERVHVLTELTCDSFLQRLESLDLLIAERGAGLVIVDSIASLARKEYDTGSKRGVAERAALLSKHAARLKYLAESFNIPIVVTNQITTHMSHVQSEGEELTMERGVVTAALGNTWSHCVNTRLLLQFMPDGKRMLLVAKSPLCGREGFVVHIGDKGLTLDWTATGELPSQQWSGDPTELSLTVRSNVGLGVQFPGEYPQ